MTATDELRRLLDERGVEHEDDEDVTRFFGPDGFEVVMQEDIDGKLDCLTPIYLTPEQAVAATLGAGTCRKVYLVEESDELIEGWYPLVAYLSREAAEGHAELLRGEYDDIRQFARVVELKVVDE